jgi:hypothetical protein
VAFRPLNAHPAINAALAAGFVVGRGGNGPCLQAQLFIGLISEA